MKKLLFSALTMIAIVTMASCSSELDNLPNATAPEHSKEVRVKQKEANLLSMNLQESFNSSVTKSATSSYPDYYGGVYINKNGDLVVLVVGDTAEYKEPLSRMAKSNNIILEPCQFSYKTLIGTIDRLNEFVLNANNASIVDNLKVQCFGVQDDKNHIFIALKDYSPEKIALFKNQVIDSPCLVFEPAVGEIRFEAELNGGCRLTANSAAASMGYRALANGTPGIVTSGHFVRNLNVPIYYYNELIGYSSKYQTYGAVDAAFIPVNPYFNPSNYTVQRTMLSNRTEVMGVGSIVNMEGQVNGLKWGAVTRTNLTISGTIGGMNITITNVTAARYSSSQGDSGGVIYSDAYNVAGIHEASNTTSGEAYYILANNINNSFGLTMY